MKILHSVTKHWLAIATIALLATTATSCEDSDSDGETKPEENRAISFDGVDDYIDLGNIYDDLGFPITISAWVWLDPTATSPSGSIPIFDSQEGLAVYNGFSFVTSLTSTNSNVGVTYGDGLGENNVA